jgi:sugar lactone lactonase YvrE
MTNLAGLPGITGNMDGSGAEAGFVLPRGVAVGQAGKVYVADGHHVLTVTPGGETSLFPQHGRGPGDEITFDLPSGIAVDGKGNVFVADRYTIEKITPAGEANILAGTEHHGGITDGWGREARFSDMEKGIALDAAGNLYVGDRLNHTIRKVTPEGKVTTLAGMAGRPAGCVDGVGADARFSSPLGVAVSGEGIVYVADSGNHIIRAITPEGLVSTLAGVAGKPGLADGPATNALFNTPMGVAVDGKGNVYIADTGNCLVRRITPARQVLSMGRPAVPPSGPRRAPPSAPAPPGTLPEIAQRCAHLARAGVGEQVILTVVRQDRKDHKEPYNLSDAQIIYLRNQGVSEDVIVALIQ